MGGMRLSAFERLYERHAQPLYAFLAYRTGDSALAEDLLAETFERALRGRRGFDSGRGTEKAWLYTIALNCLRDTHRRAGAERRALERASPKTAPSDRGMMVIEQRATLGSALATLSEVERDAIALRFGADLTVPQIAKVTGESLTTVEGRVYRALRKLRTALDETGG
jgi:RNA polymerase sigma-70 factor (ECF subfamily)